MKKILISFVLGIFLLTLATASIPNLGTVQQYDCINLKQTCPDCSYNNITSVDYPNRTTEALSLEVEMTKDGTEYNYTFCNTSALGTYLVNGKGDTDGSDTWNYMFDVTTTGGDSNLPIPIFLLLASVILFVSGIVLKNPPFGFFSGILFIMSGMYMMIYGFGNVADLYTQAFALVTLGFGMIVSTLAGYSWLDEYD